MFKYEKIGENPITIKNNWPWWPSGLSRHIKKMKKRRPGKVLLKARKNTTTHSPEDYYSHPGPALGFITF